MSVVHTLRESARRWLPPPVRRPLRVPFTYGERLLWWARVLREIDGRTPADRRRLAVSAAAAPLTALKGLSEWRDPELLFDIDVVVGEGHLFSVRARTDDLFHVLPRREPAVLDTILRRLAPGDVFVDAGANIGFYTVLAARHVGPAGRVHAIEMMPATAARLREHVRVNRLSNVRVIEAALASVGGQRVVAHAPEGRFGQARLNAAETSLAGSRADVVTDTLDRVLDDEPRIHLMKMDLEGAEADALMGASSILRRVDAIVFEDLSQGPADRSKAARLLEASGFEVRPLGGKDLLATRPGDPRGAPT